MVSYKTKLGTAIVTVSLLASSFGPIAYANTTIDILGNGDNSNNTVNVSNNYTTDINQTNSFSVSLDINSSAKTGKNEANNNTGGNITIDTGNATSNVTVNVAGGSNTANVPCGCANITDKVTVSGNGDNSNNTGNVTNKKEKIAKQTNTGGVSGPVKSKAKTDKNKANNNTNGTVDVFTGNSTSNVTVNVTAPSNTLNVTP